MDRYGKKWVVWILALLFSTSAHATLISYTAMNTSGDIWQYDFRVTNDTLGIPLESISIEFSANEFLLDGSLPFAAPAGWDAAILPTIPVFNVSGVFDLFAFSGGILATETQSGFSVSVQALRDGAAPSTLFTINDPTTFDVVEMGIATLEVPQPVSEPGVLVLMVLGMALLLHRRGLLRIHPVLGNQP